MSSAIAVGVRAPSLSPCEHFRSLNDLKHPNYTTRQYSRVGCERVHSAIRAHRSACRKYSTRRPFTFYPTVAPSRYRRQSANLETKGAVEHCVATTAHCIPKRPAQPLSSGRPRGAAADVTGLGRTHGVLDRGPATDSDRACVAGGNMFAADWTRT